MASKDTNDNMKLKEMLWNEVDMDEEERTALRKGVMKSDFMKRVMKSTTDEKKKEFWSVKEYKNGDEFIDLERGKITEFLRHNKWGRWRLGDKRTSSSELFRRNGAILESHDERTALVWMYQYAESLKQSDMEKHWFLREELLEATQSLSDTKWDRALEFLDVYSEEGTENSKKLDLFSDDKETAHYFFRNGVVRITAEEIELIAWDAWKKDAKQGCIWESSINKERSVQIVAKSKKGIFELFWERAFLRQTKSVHTLRDWRTAFEMTEEAEDHYRASRVAYGYLLHNFQGPAETKCVAFIDANADLKKTEGRNGKSLLMNSLKHFKKLTTIDGRAFRKAVGESARFNFAQVEKDTRVVLIDDITPDFEFLQMFSLLTGDMKVERKGTNAFMIRHEKKPKFCLTTNYPLVETGQSHIDRRFIVEVGSYWNQANKQGEAVSDKKHMGKMFFTEFNDSDWNEFYSCGFRCVQEWLRAGKLVATKHANYEEKARKFSIEGIEEVGFTDWFTEWMEIECVKQGANTGDGIAVESLYSQFQSDRTDAHWSFDSFKQGLWRYCECTKGMGYNEHLASKGSTFSSRRMLKGKRGEQKEHVILTVAT